MPAFAEQLDDAQIQQIVAYLLTLTAQGFRPRDGRSRPRAKKFTTRAAALVPHHRGARRRLGAGAHDGRPAPWRRLPSDRGSLSRLGFAAGARVLETGGQLDYLFIHLVTKDGTRLRWHARGGRLLPHRDKGRHGKFHSFRKSDLREFDKEPGKSVMPSFKDKLCARR